MRASGKDGRKVYCDEEELRYLKDCLKARRAGGTTDTYGHNVTIDGIGDLGTKLDQVLDYMSDLKSEVYTLRTYTISELERKISALTHKVEQLSGQSY